MYRILRFSAVLCILLLAATASGQFGRIKHTVVTGHHALPTMGHEVWFAVPGKTVGQGFSATLYLAITRLSHPILGES